MGQQNIDFSNVDGVTFNGNSLNGIVLNGTQVWGLPWTSEQKILAPDTGETQANHHFGFSSDINGDWAVVGAYAETHALMPSHGAIYTFKRTGDTWNYTQKIHHPDFHPNDYFGYSVAIDGDYIIVGSFGDGDFWDSHPTKAGTAHIYKRSGDTWNYQTELRGLLPDTLGEQFGFQPEQGLFGKKVAISGDYAIVGAPNIDWNGVKNNAGAAWIFKRNGTNWIEEAKCIPGVNELTDLNSDAYFGDAVAIDGNTGEAIIGAASQANGTGPGATYLFKRTPDGTWGTTITNAGPTGIPSMGMWIRGATQKLTPPGGGADNDRFGDSVAIDGDFIVVGASGYSQYQTNAGTAYIFNRTHSGNFDSAFSFHRIDASDKSSGETFGHSVAIDGDYIIVGALMQGDGASAQGIGAAYIFERTGHSSWAELRRIRASDYNSDDRFGSSVGIRGKYAIVGAFKEDENGADAGAAYIFEQ